MGVIQVCRQVDVGAFFFRVPDFDMSRAARGEPYRKCPEGLHEAFLLDLAPIGPDGAKARPTPA